MYNIKLKVDLKDIERLSKEAPEVSRSVRISKITEAVNLLERAISMLTPIGAGPTHLRSTIFNRVDMYGETISGTIGTPAIYGEAVEYGTKPHFPPVAPIQHWVERKLGISGKDAKTVAFLIARKISKHGTKGAHMFEKGFADNEARIRRMLESIPEEIVRRLKG
jgi:hypothetical protein